ncbi:CheR family methyltransferase [Desulfobacterium sp. N47]|uniref:CheR-type methyltransferase domain-containing protein n=1 Tax=uncultured Desulfobacterium sp. TaxID=201089 RepID=E1YJ53_9BACT|nr:hypothetical protein N47_E48190 [uncultured Desulfobacterium sp.]
MEEALKEIIRVMYQQYSMDISCYEESFLVQSIDKRLVANSISGHEKYSGRLAEDHMEAEDLFNSLKICYSEFFRDPLTFNLLEQIVLPNIIEEKIKSGCTEIRIWSVGCSAGQEAYSVAMLLDELIEMRSIPLHFRIFATDNSEAEVLSVKNGTYNIVDPMSRLIFIKIKLPKVSDIFSGLYSI